MRLGDLDELKKHAREVHEDNGIEVVPLMMVPVSAIDNAPTVPLPDFKEGYKQAILDGKTNFARLQGEWKITGDVTCECQFCHYPHVYALSPKECGLNFCTRCGADMKGGTK